MWEYGVDVEKMMAYHPKVVEIGMMGSEEHDHRFRNELARLTTIATTTNTMWESRIWFFNFCLYKKFFQPKKFRPDPKNFSAAHTNPFFDKKECRPKWHVVGKHITGYNFTRFLRWPLKMVIWAIDDHQTGMMQRNWLIFYQCGYQNIKKNTQII